MAESLSYSERDLDLIPHLSFSFVENYIKRKKKSSGEKSISKGFKYFSEGYIQDLKVSKSAESCCVTGKCYRSQRKNEQPHQIKLSFMQTTGSDVNISFAHCSCPIGLSGLCGHMVGTLYQLANYKALGYKALPEDIAKTSQPQTFHVPRGVKIQGKAVQDLEVRGYSKTPSSSDPLSIPREVQSTLYNPIRGEKVNWSCHVESFKKVDANTLILPALELTDIPLVDSKFGKVPKGSVLSYQQKPEAGIVMNIYDGVTFPDMPVSNLMINKHQTVLDETKTTSLENLRLTKQEAVRFEKQTRLQSGNPLWFRIRKNRLTASKIGEIFKRKKDPSILVKRLKSTRSVTTAAMRQGLASEPLAASSYAALREKRINIYPCGVVVSLCSPWLAASPDRKVYNVEMTPPFGLLEIKCPQVSSVLEVPYLVKNDGGVLKLNRNHQYYFQVLTQLAVTGLQWCDLFVWCQSDHHCETIYFNQHIWQEVKDKVDDFFFNFFI